MTAYDLGVSRGVQRLRRLPLLSVKRSQRKEASVNQHEIEKDFMKHKWVKAADTEQKPAPRSLALAGSGQ